MRYRLTIAYDGTQFAGWQVQKNATAIQPLIQKALQTILRHDLDLTGAGRTDAGVHARGQKAHFDSHVSFEPKKFLKSLNALLPKEIRVISVEDVPPHFHARYCAKRKIYHYHIHFAPVANPFFAPYRFQVFDPIEISQLQRASKLFLGTRDFTSFANETSGKTSGKTSRQTSGDQKLENPIRTLYRFDAVEETEGVRLELEGNGFLYKMVRNLVGTLLDVARGKLLTEQVEDIFAAKDRRRASMAVPAHGLFLHQVCY